MRMKCRQLIALRRGPNGVIGAPAWLRERMARLRALPPPTLEEVRIQFAASANQRDSIQCELDEKIRKGVPIR